jgi:hypothetical protein
MKPCKNVPNHIASVINLLQFFSLTTEVQQQQQIHHITRHHPSSSFKK